MASPAFALALPPGSPAPPAAAVARSRPQARSDGLTGSQRHVAIAAIVALHLVGIWALLQVREVRQAMRAAAPMFVSLIAPERPPEPVVPPPPKAPPPKAVVRPLPVIAAAPTPQPAPAQAVVVPLQVEPPPPAEVTVATPSTPAAPAPVQPKLIPPSAVQYLEPISLDYPRLSRKLGEAGRVMLRIYIGEDGLAKNVEVAQSSKFGRLDEAALVAVRKARFRPPTVNGQRVEGWANVPIDFELEK